MQHWGKSMTMRNIPVPRGSMTVNLANVQFLDGQIVGSSIAALDSIGYQRFIRYSDFSNNVLVVFLPLSLKFKEIMVS